jgi:hypothetical protein
MRRACSLITPVVLLIAATTLAAAQTPKPPAMPQAQKPPVAAPPAAQAQPQPAEPTVPYRQVSVTPPPTVSDPGFAAFRARLGEVAKKKDRAALARLVVSKGFFWDREGGDSADKKKSPIDNLAAAIGLDGKDAVGWDMLAGYAEDPTGSISPDHPGATCAPADPGFDGKDMQTVLDATQSDIAEWGYPVRNGVEVRDTAQQKAPVSMKLGSYFVRVTPDANAVPAAGSFLRIVTPAGKYGFVPIDDIAPLGNDQICYVKEGGDWKIAGYAGIGSDPGQ